MSRLNVLSLSIAIVLVAMTGVQAAPSHSASDDAPALAKDIPDLIKGQGPTVKEAKPDWFLHCGGTRGWIYRDERGNCDLARQILVTKVPADSAVRRKLSVGDV